MATSHTHRHCFCCLISWLTVRAKVYFYRWIVFFLLLNCIVSNHHHQLPEFSFYHHRCHHYHHHHHHHHHYHRHHHRCIRLPAKPPSCESHDFQQPKPRSVFPLLLFKKIDTYFHLTNPYFTKKIDTWLLKFWSPPVVSRFKKNCATDTWAPRPNWQTPDVLGQNSASPIEWMSR